MVFLRQPPQRSHYADTSGNILSSVFIIVERAASSRSAGVERGFSHTALSACSADTAI